MKIAFFTDTYPPYINGVATHIAMLKKIFEEMGHEVLIVTVGSEKLEEIKIENNIVYVPGYLLKKIYNYRVALPVNSEKIELIDNFNPDIIHIQTEFGIGHSGLRMAKNKNIPLVYTLHSEYDEFLFYVGLKYFQTFSRKISDKYFNRFFKYADIVTSPSPKAQVYMDRQKLDKKVVVINNAVEVKLFEKTEEKEIFRENFRKEFNINDNCKAFVFVGRIGGEKNILELINNWIYCNFSRDEAVLFIIGDGPDSKNMEKIISENNFNDRIYYLGKKPNTEIPKYLYSMDYYTTASLSEMHSISMLEAMATGLPCLIKLDKPNSHQIKPGINGYQWNTKEEFKKLFTDAINLSDDKYKDFKQSTLNYAKSHDNYHQAEELLEVYKKAIEIKNIRNNTEA